MDNRVQLIIDAGHCLPDDLVIEILSTLQTPLLGALKIVCPNLRRIINMAEFTHLQASSRPNRTINFTDVQASSWQSRTKLYITHVIPDYQEFPDAEFFADHLKDVAKEDEEDFFLDAEHTLRLVRFTHNLGEQELLRYKKAWNDQIRFIGPVDGLLLIHAYLSKSHRIALWNPTTSEFNVIPMPNFSFDTLTPSSHIIGLGFNVNLQDYKVVWVVLANSNDSPGSQVATYSVTNDKWTFIANPDTLALVHKIALQCTCPKEHGDIFSAAYLDGKIYWLIDCSCRQQMLAFNLYHQSFEEVEAPHNMRFEAKLLGHNRLLQMGDAIALFGIDYFTNPSTIYGYMMRKPGCWVNLFHINHREYIFVTPGTDAERIRHVVGFWRLDLDQERIFVETTKDKLFLYNLKYGAAFDFELMSSFHPRHFLLHVFSYRDSLTSVGGGNRRIQGPTVRDAIQRFLRLEDQV